MTLINGYIKIMNEKIDEDAVIQMYVNDCFSMRRIADIVGTNHHMIKRILERHGIVICQKNRVRKPFTIEHKQKISESRKKLKENGWIPYNKGLKTINRKDGRGLLYKNMLAHLRFSVSIDWLMRFDFEKLKALNTAISNRSNRWNITTDEYVRYIEHFYNDKQFLIVYEKYRNNPCTYTKPSIDHIIPKSKGGTNDLSNLQFLSWFENRCKNDMSQEDWDIIKTNIKEYLI